MTEPTPDPTPDLETPRDYRDEPGLDGRSPGGIRTDGGRPLVDEGGRPVPLDRPSADEVEAQAQEPTP